jgi:hypothetical protein
MWYDVFDAVFWLSIASFFFGSIAVTLSFCFKSKCKKCNICFGFIDVERDVIAENEETKMELEHIPRVESTNSLSRMV